MSTDLETVHVTINGDVVAPDGPGFFYEFDVGWAASNLHEIDLRAVRFTEGTLDLRFGSPGRGAVSYSFAGVDVVNVDIDWCAIGDPEEVSDLTWKAPYGFGFASRSVALDFYARSCRITTCDRVAGP